MRETKFKVGDLVTRGRGRDTFRVVNVRKDGPSYDLINAVNTRNRARRIYGVAESNLRLAKEADNE